MTRSVRLRPAGLRAASMTALGVAAVAGGLIGAAGPAAAGETITYHYQTDATGAQVRCGSTLLTAVSGSVFDGVFHENADNRGEYHGTGTETPSPVTFTDAQGNLYSLNGASWFGGTFTDPDGNDPVVLTSTDEFTITNSSGGLFGRMNAVTHLSSNGEYFSISLGNCTFDNGD